MHVPRARWLFVAVVRVSLSLSISQLCSLVVQCALSGQTYNRCARSCVQAVGEVAAFAAPLSLTQNTSPQEGKLDGILSCTLAAYTLLQKGQCLLPFEIFVVLSSMVL